MHFLLLNSSRLRLRLFALLGTLFATACLANADSKSFNEDVSKAAVAVRPIIPETEAMMNAGDYSGSNAKLMSVFPEASRTPAQSFVLANMLFEVDRAVSFKLHEAAAKAQPDNPPVILEWAMELHRAGKWAEALEQYGKFRKAKPSFAASYGLSADCHLRLGHVDEAIAAWTRSEDAADGDIEQFETFVCSVHQQPLPYAQRAELLAKVKNNHDVNAAKDLIALDCDFRRDWWNAGPNAEYLKNDRAAIAAAIPLPADDVQQRAMDAAADASLARYESLTADDSGAAKVKAIFEKQKLFIDADHTIPAHAGLLTVLANSASATGAIDDATLRKFIYPKALDAARKGHDPIAWNAAALLARSDKPEEMIDIEREGWKACGDVRFAVGTLQLRDQLKPLALDDAELNDALNRFPDSADVRHLQIVIEHRDNKLTRAMLADAARAEFSHFSSFEAPATLVNRPRADYLRAYFKQMARMPADAAATQPGK